MKNYSRPLEESCGMGKFESRKYEDFPSFEPSHVSQSQWPTALTSSRWRHLRPQRIMRSTFRARWCLTKAWQIRALKSHMTWLPAMPNKLRSTSPSTWRISTRWIELSIAVCESVSRAKNLYPTLVNYSGTMRTPMTMKPNATLRNASLILESSYEPLLRLAAVDLYS